VPEPVARQKTEGAAPPVEPVSTSPAKQMPVKPEEPAFPQTVHEAGAASIPTNKNAWRCFTGALLKYAVFSGRTGRAEFWFYALFQLIFTAGAGLLVFCQYHRLIKFYYIDIEAFWLVTLSYMLPYILGFLLPCAAVLVRRMHDAGKSGWFLLVPVYDVVLLVSKGTSGTNRFGPDPKGEPVQQQTGAASVPANKNAWRYFTGALPRCTVFSGRTGRAEFWFYTLFINIFITGICLLIFFLRWAFFSTLYIPMSVLRQPYILGFLLLDAAVAVRRMHDVDKSGWFGLIPIHDIVLFLSKGTSGTNRFGPDPKGVSHDLPIL
jgi:uncharacterized membrane protein YhaH (DUF805 family)